MKRFCVFFFFPRSSFILTSVSLCLSLCGFSIGLQLRQQLVDDGNQVFEDFLDPKAGNDEEACNGVPDFDQPDDDIHEFMDEDIPFRDDQVCLINYFAR